MSNLWMDMLPVVTLPELNEKASRLSRVDRKYLVPRGDVENLIRDVPGVRILDVEGRRLTHYQSVYYDTPSLDAYHLAGHSRRRRFKVCTRAYENDTVYMEVKWRDGRGTPHKERQISGPHDHEFVAAVLGRVGVAVDTSCLQQTLRTSYRRVTMLLPGEDARVTIDEGLTCSSTTSTVSFPDHAIVETKAGTRLTTMDRALHRLHYRATTNSKYGVGMALTTPGLPPEKWHRTLHTLTGQRS